MTLPAGIIKTPRSDGGATYHNGTIFDGAVPFHAASYSDNGITVPFHIWLGRWTYRPNPIAVVRSPAQIVSADQMFPFGDTGCKVGTVSNYTFAGPTDNAGITKYFPQTGERPDIGLVTDPSAQFMLGGAVGPMLAWAQAANSVPMHFRDEATGKPVDLLKYPQANCNDLPGQGVPFLLKGLPDPKAPAYGQFGDNWQPQQAHYPELSYIAYLATQDEAFLEDLQYSANFTVCTDAAVSAHRGIATISGELRGMAWAFRNLFMAHAATLDAEARGTLPATCHPSSYWQKLLDNQLSYYQKFMADPANQVFRLIYGPGMFGPWQNDFLLMALAFGVLTGHSDWAPLYLWALKNAIDRTSGKSGYPPGYGVPYYMMGDQPDWKSAWLAMAPPYASPPTAAEIATLTADPLNGGKAMYLNEAMMTTRAVLVQALYLEKIGKLPDLHTTYPDIDSCFTNADRMCRNYGAMNPRASMVLDASKVPDTIPPLPPVVTPPPTTTPPPISTGDIIVSDPAFNAPFTATASFKDNLGNSMTPDTVSWVGPSSFAITKDIANPLVAHGVYGKSGASTITAVGTKAGVTVTVQKEVTVPEAVPFLATGEITLS